MGRITINELSGLGYGIARLVSTWAVWGFMRMSHTVSMLLKFNITRSGPYRIRIRLFDMPSHYSPLNVILDSNVLSTISCNGTGKPILLTIARKSLEEGSHSIEIRPVSASRTPANTD